MKIAFLGAGNVATNMALAFKNAGLDLVQVYNHRIESASELAAKLGCNATDSIADLNPDADCYIIAIKDDAIQGLAIQLELRGKLVVHTSGSVSMEVLKPASSRVGVLYPLQTFSKQRLLDFTTIPFFIEAGDSHSLSIIESLARRVSQSVIVTSYEQRKILHLSAVFACNFVNHLYDLSVGLLAEHNLSFEALQPLILETALKIQSISPHEGQTGPARRNDQEVMTKHLQLLSNNPPLQYIYQLLSDSIVKSFHK
ncbi:DUF2520 domain-containing protein [Solitalea sp. MAHUQ-68]|uniref:DUF2520 domain-containing protein n=1 Tax=Solitalea agri TaxID=2953739 RepID=A0A9X2FC53_9SPHI|nr:Rossmann-like and DUF2520 domain-containing protein [Solitalea agri]MCO4294163.1 DUF2520 domain-containing protein [Solitalea agri]